MSADRVEAEALADWSDEWGHWTPDARFMEDHGLDWADLCPDEPDRGGNA